MGSTSNTPHPIVVIGAGLGGLSAAIRLASRGYRVTVCEQLSRPGGKMGELRQDGYRWDTGPSVLTLRHVYEQLFREAGRDLNDYVQLMPLDPITRYFWPDGLVLDATSDEAVMAERIAQFAPGEVSGYRRFMRYIKGIYDTIQGPFLHRQQPSLRELIGMPVTDVFKIDALRTMHAATVAYFRDPHLVQLFDRFATYNGSSPFQAPATLNVIAHVEMAMGAWYPQGGVYQLALAYAQLALDVGVEIRYGACVTEIDLKGNSVRGIRLATGDVLAAEAVISNADVSWTYQTLLPAQAPHPNLRLEPSCSGFVQLLGLGAQHAKLAHHNIFFNAPEAYVDEFDDIFKRQVPPAHPTLYACITSKSDARHAPAGHENWFLMTNTPYLSNQFDWSTQAEAYGAQVKGQMAAHMARLKHPDWASYITTQHTLTPRDLQNAYGGNQGSIYGFSSNTKLAAFLRPNNRAKGLRGLYFATGSAHPGGGVPLVTLSGAAAAECVMQDLSG